MTTSQSAQTILSRFIEVARNHPDKIAVKWKDKRSWEQMTYSELLARSEAVADMLADLGVGEGNAVILASARHANLCANLLGILWCGAHYVFIDPNYPLERQKFIADAVSAKFGIASPGSSRLNHLNLCWLDTANRSQSPNDSGKAIPENRELPAYVMFTSGSTGVPKGVVIPQRAVLRLVTDTNYISFSEHQTFLQLSALSFDASTLEIWGPLLNGGTCVLHPENEVITPAEIESVLASQQVTTLWLTASLFNTLITDHPEALKPVKQLLTGGEALSVPHVRKALTQLPQTSFFNGYGPTENTTFTTVFPIPKALPEDIKRIPIGYPIHGTECALVDENLNVLSGPGQTGELVAFGDGLARCYLNKPELTREKFVRIEVSPGTVRTAYRTGDLVTRNEQGCFDYLSRIDKQVKIDGHRIEPGEIEYRLNELDDIKEARVVVRVGPQGQKRLAAYAVSDSRLESQALRDALGAILPRYMVPHFFIQIEKLPKNRNGKLDESQLPDPFTLHQEPVAPALTKSVKDTVSESWKTVLSRAVDDTMNFMDAGGTSLEALKLATRLEKSFGVELSATFVFEYPTIEQQSRFFTSTLDRGAAGTVTPHSRKEGSEFAIIGMACRFPGANNLDEYWQNLLAGKETVSFFTEEELSAEVDAGERSNPAYVRAKGIVEGCDQFDAKFFGISPIEAKIMDPQQRILLELSWHALEDAAIPPGDSQYRTGVFAGMNWARYYQQYVLPNKDLVDSYGVLNCGLANEPDLLSTRISYKLNLKGPSVNVFTACSTGLVAVAQACEAIESGQCEQAIAAGVSISTPIKRGYLYQEGSMLSRDGHCRPFDQNATGTTFNDGAGVVVLKRRDLAEQDGDNIYAVIKGYAVNNDGERKASFTAPSIAGQVSVYTEALRRAAIEPSSVGFIETHGTATPLGDPIEVLSLKRCYAAGNETPEKTCALGSVKSNIGHAIHAAGLASLIKTALAIRENKIPPTLFFEQPNPKLELEKSSFYVNTAVAAWKLPSPRRAAVTSLGVGGTNAHVILEEYVAPERPQRRPDRGTGRHRATDVPILISAKTQAALDRQMARHQDYLEAKQDIALPDVSYTSIHGRKHFEHRAIVFGSDPATVARNINEGKSLAKGKSDSGLNQKLGFMFSGQGTQAKMMGHWLYSNSPTYQATFDHGCEITLAATGIDIRETLFSEKTQLKDEGMVHQTAFVQPALFLLEYGLANHLIAKGLSPALLLGHSIGEFAAATLAGVFRFEEAVKLVANRGALMQSMPPGQMLIVRSDYEAIAPLLAQRAELAAVNAPGLIVLSGERDSIQELSREFSTRKIASTVLQTSHAFHSSMMEPVVSEFERLVSSTERQPPAIPMFSTMTGALLSDQEAVSPRYWSQQLRHPVLFSKALQTLGRIHENDGEGLCLVEVGPGNTLCNLTSCHQQLEHVHAFAALAGKGIDQQAEHDIHGCIGQLWVHGYEPEWRQYFDSWQVRKERLPGYAFSEDRYWLGPVEKELGNMERSKGEALASLSSTVQQEVKMDAQQHVNRIRTDLMGIIEDVSGYELGDVDPASHFSEVGLDSLLLTQIATAIEKKFQVGITFRHLVEEYTSLELVTDFISPKVEPEAVEQPQSDLTVQTANTGQIDVTTTALSATLPSHSGTIQDIVNAQLQLMQLQLQALTHHNAPLPGTDVPANAQGLVAAPPATATPDSSSSDNRVSDHRVSENNGSDNPRSSAHAANSETPNKVPHTPGTRISKEAANTTLTSAQKQWIETLMANYQEKYAGSKSYTQKHRQHLADPRSVSGFNPAWKEIIFPIVTVKSKGSKLWDIDGNELIDTSNGFGPILFGHAPDFISDVAKAQIDQGIETGPQSPLAGEVAELFCELTGNERCTFACTGSEANVGALRIARTVTGRSKVVAFEGSYHGIHDEVVMRPGKDRSALPAAPGIPREATANMMLLPWGAESSLEELRKLGDDIAAVLVEPVQSRKPQFHSEEYLKELRKITEENGVALILDEVVTGFRVGPGGIRKRFDIDADLVTYGKVVGGGYPIGIIGGKAKYMDAMDGGYWQFGDDSIPEQGVTFFAGTFVRHPLGLAVAKAVLTRIKEDGASIYPELEATTAAMAEEAKAFISKLQSNVSFEEFASLFYLSVPHSAQWGHLLFLSMTLDGIHIQQYRPNFLTTEHSRADVRKILDAFKKALANLIVIGLLEGDQVAAKKFLSGGSNIPPGARLGKNEHGEPAYFVEDPNNAGAYVEVGRP